MTESAPLLLVYPKYFANGDEYTGDWFDGIMTGHGTRIYANRDRYE